MMDNTNIMNTSFDNTVMAVLPSCLLDDMKRLVVQYNVSTFCYLDRKTQEVFLDILIECLLNMNCVHLHPVTFELRWKPYINAFDRGTLEDMFDWYQKKRVLDELESWDWETVPFLGITHMDIKATIPYFSHNGTRYFDDDFKFSIDNPTGITIRNITESVYRVRGTIYNGNDENVNELKITDLTDTSISLKTSQLLC